MNIAFVGLSGVPYSKRASDYRLLAFAKAFTSKKHTVHIINRFSNINKLKITSEKLQFDSIVIKNLIEKEISKESFFNVFYQLISYPFEFFKIIHFNRKTKIDVLHIYSGHFLEFIHYYLIAKIIRAKIIYQYVEFRSAIERKNIYHKLNGYFCDRSAVHLFDGIISISNFIEKHISKISRNIPTIKVPPIFDFQYLNNIEKIKSNENYILYCGSTSYFEVIEFIIKAYDLSQCKTENIKLFLVINGSSSQITKIKRLVQDNKNIFIKSELDYKDLINLYLNAKALLIPLRNTIQDIARFPNKISEYTACKNIIITTNNGEIPYYFSNKKNALIAKHYTAESVAQEIDWMIENKAQLDTIKRNAYKLGCTSFNMDNYIEDLNNFLIAIRNNKIKNKNKNARYKSLNVNINKLV